MNTFKVYIIQTSTEYNRVVGKSIRHAGNLTIAYLAAICPEYCEVKLCDETYQRIDYDYNADIVAISAVTATINQAYAIAMQFKKEQGSWTIVGGCHATVHSDDCLQYVDSVCVGEADVTFPKLIDSVYKTGKAERKYWNPSPINLSNLPHPRRKLLEPHGIYLHGIQMTRGCQHFCEFCSIRNLYGWNVRVRPVDDVIKEIAETIEGNKFAFWDDNIIASRNHAYELFTKMIPLKKKWVSPCCLNIADDDELLIQAAKSGCTRLFIGFESFNEQSLKKMKKGFNKACRYKERIKKIHDCGIIVSGGIIFGSDDDDPFIFERSLEAIEYVGIDLMSPTICTPMPGTELTKRLLKERRIFDFNWDHYDYRHVVYKPKKMTEKQLAEGYDWFYNQFYTLPRIAKRMAESFLHSTPLFYHQAIHAFEYRRTAKQICGPGKNPARYVIDGVALPQEEEFNYRQWAHHAKYEKESRVAL